jgi:hypothetical protein
VLNRNGSNKDLPSTKKNIVSENTNNVKKNPAGTA